MLTPWEIVQKEMIPPARFVSKNLTGVLILLKIMLFQRGAGGGLDEQPGRRNYVRPARKYDLPCFQAGMKNFSRNKKYLRPTLYCNCRAPEITAMAQELGAGRKSDHEFAEAAYEFTKRNIAIEMMPLDGVECTLSRGTGTCVQKISLFVALCRAAGIPARFRFCSLSDLGTWLDRPLQNAPLLQKWLIAMGDFMLHGEGEALIDGQWLTADISVEPLWQAAHGLPVTRLGESSVGHWMFPVPGSTFTRESVTLGMGTSTRILFKHLVPGSLPGFNLGVEEQVEKGRRTVAAAGGEAAYDAEARRRLVPAASRADLVRDHDNIVFGGK